MRKARRRRRSVALQSLPTAGVALAVNDGDDRDKIREDAIDDPIRKARGQGLSGLAVDDGKKRGQVGEKSDAALEKCEVDLKKIEELRKNNNGIV